MARKVAHCVPSRNVFLTASVNSADVGFRGFSSIKPPVKSYTLVFYG